jgi:phosphate/sulfate permease
VVQAVLVYPQALQAHQLIMLVAVAVVVGYILLEVAVVLVAVVKAVIQPQLQLDQGQQ